MQRYYTTGKNVLEYYAPDTQGNPLSRVILKNYHGESASSKQWRSVRLFLKKNWVNKLKDDSAISDRPTGVKPLLALDDASVSMYTFQSIMLLIRMIQFTRIWWLLQPALSTGFDSLLLRSK